MMGYNRYFGWYYGQADDFGPYMDALHAAHPDDPAVGQRVRCRRRAVATYRQPTRRADQLLRPAASGGIPELVARAELAAAGEAALPVGQLGVEHVRLRLEYPPGRRLHRHQRQGAGVLRPQGRGRTPSTSTRRTGRSSRCVHINGRRYVHRAYAVNDVRIYSNADRVQVALNGHPLGEVPCHDADLRAARRGAGAGGEPDHGAGALRSSAR